MRETCQVAKYTVTVSHDRDSDRECRAIPHVKVSDACSVWTAPRDASSVTAPRSASDSFRFLLEQTCDSVNWYGRVGGLTL
jgi:hypothetical protein